MGKSKQRCALCRRGTDLSRQKISRRRFSETQAGTGSLSSERAEDHPAAVSGRVGWNRLVAAPRAGEVAAEEQCSRSGRVPAIVRLARARAQAAEECPPKFRRHLLG